MDYPFSTGWNIKKIIFWTTASALLLGSWIWPVSRVLWDKVDIFCFRMLNATVAWGKLFAVFWAVTGDRVFDAVGALGVFVMFVVFLLRRGEAFFRRGLPIGIVTAVILLVVIGLQRQVISYPRNSPGKIFKDQHSIQAQVSWSRAKEASPSSFPGDHATVMVILTILWWKAFGPGLGRVMLGLTFLFGLPRMAAGAHWMTDAVIGGGFVVLLMLAVVDGMPLGFWFYRFSRPWSDRFVDFTLAKRWIKF